MDDIYPREVIKITLWHKIIKKVNVGEVRYFKSEDKAITVDHGEGTSIIIETIKDLEEEFEESFIRISRSTLAAKKYIRKIVKISYGVYTLVLRDGRQLPISRRYSTSVVSVLRGLLEERKKNSEVVG